MPFAEDRPWLKGLQAHYDAHIREAVENAEKRRQRADALVRNLLQKWTPIALVVVAIAWMIDTAAGVVVALAGGIFISLYASKVQGEGKDLDLKKVVLDYLGPFFSISFNQPKAFGDASRFVRLGLLPDHDSLKVHDRAKGEHRGVEFEMIEVYLEAEKYSPIASSSVFDKVPVTVFFGTIFKFPFNKKFTGTTIVYSDQERLDPISELLRRKYERVRLEDPVFENHFAAYSTDQIEARYLLTPGFMEQILALCRHLGSSVQVGFNRKELLCVVDDYAARFNLAFSSNTTLEEQVHRMVADITGIYDLIEGLKLHERTHA